MNTHSTLAGLKKLTTEDEEVYKEVKTLLTPISVEEKVEIVKLISQFNERRLFVLSEKNIELQNFFNSDALFNKALSEGDRYPDHLPKQMFSSMDQKDSYSPFRQLMSEFLLAEYEKAESAIMAIEFLNKACEEGSFHALQERMRINIKKIADMKKSESKIDINEVRKCILSNIVDGAKMGNLYRSLGFFQAANMLLDTAKKYFELPGVKTTINLHNIAISGLSRKEKISPKQVYVNEWVILLESTLENAMEFYVLAFLTSKFSSSKFFNDVINNGQDLLKDFSEIFYDWDSGKRFIISAIRDVYDVRSPKLFEKGIKRAQALLEQNPQEKEYKLGFINVI